MNTTQTAETATDSTVTITADHGMVDSKGRRLGGYAEIKSGDLGIAVRIYSTRDGKQFGASFPRPTVHARGEMAAARKQALKSLTAQGARCAKMAGATAVDTRSPSQKRADAPIEARAAAAKVAPAAPAAAPTVTEQQKRTVACPKCGRAVGRKCRALKYHMASWTPGEVDQEVAHRERRAAYLATAPKCPGVDDAALESRAADLRASVGSIPGMTPDPTLADSLRARGMTYRLAATDGKCDILRDGKVVFCGTAGETWAWLRAQPAPIATLVPVSKMHPRPVHYIRAWTAIEADETPLCGIPIEQCFMDRTTIGTTHDTAGAPMPICTKCAKLAGF